MGCPTVALVDVKWSITGAFEHVSFWGYRCGRVRAQSNNYAKSWLSFLIHGFVLRNSLSIIKASSLFREVFFGLLGTALVAQAGSRCSINRVTKNNDG